MRPFIDFIDDPAVYTMKLNATTEMLGVTWPEFSNLHPFACGQTEGYREMFDELESG